MYVYMSVLLCVSVFAFVLECGKRGVGAHYYECMCVCECVYASVCVQFCVRVCVYEGVGARMCVQVCVCVR